MHATVRNLGKSTAVRRARCRSTCSTAATPSCRPRRSGRSSPPARARRCRAKFTRGKKASVCLVYFAPDHGKLVAISFRPTQDFDAITWTGPLAKRERRSSSTCPSVERVSVGRASVAELTVWPAARSPDNRGMSPLTLGPLTVPVPVVLAPMAGITNAAYRRLCAEQGAGLYVCEMITSRGLVERDSTTLKMLVFDELETDPLGPALRHRPGVRRQGHRDPLRGVRRPPRRPQLRLPGAQGDPQGWRGSAAVEARSARRDPAVRGRRRHAVRRAGHHEDPQGARRRPPDLPRRRPDRAGGGLRRDRAARPDRRPVLQRPGRLGGHRPAGRARRHPGPRQRRHLGGGRRAADGRADRCRRCGRRPRLPRPPLAVPRPRRRLHASALGVELRVGRAPRPVETAPPSRPSARCA